MLMLAYRSGIFPMAESREDPDIFWVEPRQRAILPLDGFHCSRSLARVLRKDRFSVSCNGAFARVIDACAAPRRESTETWISSRIRESYLTLHALGHAHSIECWDQERLVGGLYGVGFDRVFCGELMFSVVPDASKVALAWLVAALRQCGTRLLDCQFLTPHLKSLGAVEISQSRYLELLAQAQSGDQIPIEGEGAAAGLVAGLVPAGLAAGVGLAEGAGDGTDWVPSPGTLTGVPAGFAGLAGAAAAAGFPSSPGNFIAQSLIQTS